MIAPWLIYILQIKIALKFQKIIAVQKPVVNSK